MRKFSLISIFLLLTAAVFSAGFHYDNPATLRSETSYGLFEGEWDLILFNPAHLANMTETEFYTRYDQHASYDLLEVAFRHQISRELGTLALYFTKEVDAEGGYDEVSLVDYNDYTGDGIADEKELEEISIDEFYRFDEYKFILDYGKAFSDEFQFGAGVSYYTYKDIERWDAEINYSEIDLASGTEQYWDNELHKGFYESKRSEFDFIAGSIYKLNKDITLEGAITFNSIKNGRALEEYLDEYEMGDLSGWKDYEEYTETGSDLAGGFYGSPYSGIGLNFDVRMHFRKWKDHQFTLDLSYRMANADVADGEYVETDFYEDIFVFGSYSDIYRDETTETYTRTGTGVNLGEFTVRLRYLRPFGRRVKFSTGIYYTPFNSTKTEYTEDYEYLYEYDALYGNSIYDYHSISTYSTTRDYLETYDRTEISFPLAVEIMTSKTLTWRFGARHTIGAYVDNDEWKLVDYTTNKTHEWVDNNYENYSESSLGSYDISDKYSYSEVFQYTQFKFGLCYNPLTNFYIDLQGDTSLLDFHNIYNANMGLSVRYLF